MPRYTKIVATIGPRSRDPEMLRALMMAGVNVCRVNCSHATAGSIRSDVARIRRAATELDKSVAILLDLQGPKIRTGPSAEPIELAAGDTLTIRMDSDFEGQGKTVGTTWTSLSKDVTVGEPVLFADGLLSGTVTAVRSDAVEVLMEVGGLLGAHKGINLPVTNIQAPALTAKDRADLAVGVLAGVDFVALSFVRSGTDIDVLREELSRLGCANLPVIAKIEKPEAVKNVAEILDRVEGLMVARGDLGVEIPLEQVPVVQKRLIETANRRGAVVITATQMLDSMERNPRPTRAEITDVANAILDGTDALMLSGETAVGKYPVEAVEVMDRIARQVESSEFFEPPPLDYLPDMAHGAESTVCRAACHVVRERPRPLVVFTWSGSSAIKASKSRPPKGIYAITHDQTVCDRLSMCWGVTPLKIPVISGTDELIAAGERALMKSGLLPAGTEVVVLAGHVPMRGATNMMKVEIIDGRSN
jgi:pyruvate kinase